MINPYIAEYIGEGSVDVSFGSLNARRMSVGERRVQVSVRSVRSVLWPASVVKSQNTNILRSQRHVWQAHQQACSRPSSAGLGTISVDIWSRFLIIIENPTSGLLEHFNHWSINYFPWYKGSLIYYYKLSLPVHTTCSYRLTTSQNYLHE